MKKILIIEDDISISEGLKDNLELENFKAFAESDGEKGFNAVKELSPDLIILDLMLPTMNGIDICRKLRMENNNTPVIMLTSKSSEADKVLGLEMGADDYMTKPFSIKELTARIKAILRRRTSIHEDNEHFEFDEMFIDFKKMEFIKEKNRVNMSLKEFEIMRFFVNHEGEVVSRDQLLDKVWGYEVFPTTRTVDNYILMIRKKLERNPSVPKHILTMHSAGYKFVK